MNSTISAKVCISTVTHAYSATTPHKYQFYHSHPQETTMSTRQSRDTKTTLLKLDDQVASETLLNFATKLLLLANFITSG